MCHLVYDNGEQYCDEMANKMLNGLNFGNDIVDTTKTQPHNYQMQNTSENKCPKCGESVIFEDNIKKWRKKCFGCGFEFNKFGK